MLRLAVVRYRDDNGTFDRVLADVDIRAELAAELAVAERRVFRKGRFGAAAAAEVDRAVSAVEARLKNHTTVL